MQDLTDQYVQVRGALLRCIDDAEIESLDTSTSTEGENTPTPSPGLPLSNHEFENDLIEMIDNQRWSAAIALVKQHKQLRVISSSHLNLANNTSSAFGSHNALYADFHPGDDLSVILNIYSQRLISDKTGEFASCSLSMDSVKTLSLICRCFHCITVGAWSHWGPQHFNGELVLGVIGAEWHGDDVKEPSTHILCCQGHSRHHNYAVNCVTNSSICTIGLC